MYAHGVTSGKVVIQAAVDLQFESRDGVAGMAIGR